MTIVPIFIKDLVGNVFFMNGTDTTSQSGFFGKEICIDIFLTTIV